MRRFLYFIAVLSATTTVGSFGLFAAEAPAVFPAKPVDFVTEIQPILVKSCYQCHGPVTVKGKLRLDQRDSTMKRDEAIILPGHADKSPLLALVKESEPDEVMPPKGKGEKLTADQIAMIKRWIDQGATWPDNAAQGPDPRKDHWAYKKPVRPAVPQVAKMDWVRTPIDAFILARLETEKLNPSPEADRSSLIRRVSLDLTGLPPTIAEVDAYVKDSSPDAYEKVVDRLLASPHYGERWGGAWLDLARYADSKGYAEDNARVIWRYRDWVIQAFNDNKPFDEFTIEQLAGDLLPNATKDQILATAFNRNTLSNDEGGTDDEEFRTVAVVDRVNTTYSVWMGLTMACAQCHSHKYDPITQEEYFKTYAIFNQTEDADRRDETPVLAEVSPDQQRQMDALSAEIAALEKELKASHVGATPASHVGATPASPAAGFADSRVLLKEPATRPAVRDVKAIEKDLETSKKKLADIKPVSTPIMRELSAGKSRKSQIFYRGNFLDKGPEVSPGTPAFLHPGPKDRSVDRLALAEWIVSPENPLTARVTANRYWEQLFGVGLVETSEDFGVRAAPPSNPQLLDWLATELVATKWDTKAFVKLLVTSSAYRQASKITSELLEKDPTNLLLARGPRVRATAETIRDQALAVSGLLSPKLFGAPVRPPQPKMGLSAAFGGSTDWQDSTGEDRYRRALYTAWRRSNPYPSVTTFDAPDRTVCSVKRTRTNTPLQALVTLNDPVYVEAAQALGRRMMEEGGDTTESRVTHGFRLCVAREPKESELKRLAMLYTQSRARFAKDETAARKMATEPIGPLPPGTDAAEVAAWSVVGNVLLNLDEMFLKR